MKLHREARDRRGESAALFQLGSLAARRGDNQVALARFEEAIRNDESFRSEIPSAELSASYLADVRKHYESYIDLLMQLHRASPGAGFAERGLEVSERARARALLDSLYGSLNTNPNHSNDDPELIVRANQFKKDLAVKAAQRAELIRGSAASAVAVLDEEIDQLSDAYERAASIIRARRTRTLVRSCKGAFSTGDSAAAIG